MTHEHPVHYNVTATRRSIVVVSQDAVTLAEAQALKTRFEQAPNTDAVITEIHDRAETDLTTHTRELLEDLSEAD